jgi:hypothetical protein
MTTVAENKRYPFWKTFIAILAAGAIGVLSLIIIIVPQLPSLVTANPALEGMPDTVIVLISLLNTLFLVVVAAVVGSLVAHRVGLRSLIAEKFSLGKSVFPELRSSLLLAFTSGLVLALVIGILDRLFLPFMGPEMQAITDMEVQPLLQLLMGMLYGGITEEILLRWGLMSLLVWLGGILFQRAKAPPSPQIFWGAIILAAILFGIAHLPAMAGMVQLNAMIIIRTVLLNAIGGVIYGWFFWRRHLEAGMIAHASTHVGFFILNLVLVPLIS